MHSEGVFFISKHSINVAAQRNERASENTETQQCSCVFVAFSLHNSPKRFLQPCTGCGGARPTTKGFLEGIGPCQSGRFSTVAVWLCPRVTPPAADAAPRLPAIHVPSFVHWHTAPADCFLLSYSSLLWKICLFFSIYHPSHPFSAELLVFLP